LAHRDQVLVSDGVDDQARLHGVGREKYEVGVHELTSNGFERYIGDVSLNGRPTVRPPSDSLRNADLWCRKKSSKPPEPCRTSFVRQTWHCISPTSVDEPWQVRSCDSIGIDQSQAADAEASKQLDDERPDPAKTDNADV
jgi:hypothetical protein